ncbi:hypothetical protein [Microvirga tunisiensis]|uniref:Uncharacterized protein n=1 Tax=Microvirga tunisiensis TaxID=2108360 RepID=A0A5N7MDC4_9HYPH|nr:hypothetical protein [Microvirga tunisiensis]MPR06318.1 hypothetical protein [Microvirga tunisiensis]MPR24104.1 hypothetical protein [Microvirga tunisiensis]
METAGVAQSSQKLYNRVLVVQDLSVKMDRKGRPYANFRGAFTDRKSGKPVTIFTQALGSAYERVKDHLVEGQEIRVLGAHEQRQADPANGILPTRSFRIVKLAEPKAKAPIQTDPATAPVECQVEETADQAPVAPEIPQEEPDAIASDVEPEPRSIALAVPLPASADMFD